MYPHPFMKDHLDGTLLALAGPCRAIMANPLAHLMCLPMTLGLMLAVNSYFMLTPRLKG